ncbi:MAG: Fe-S cluster assembly protein HesB [Fibrella sp.]|nr:Fe-S cluster assembly protein HesB [Armatimonadota bacterium]
MDVGEKLILVHECLCAEYNCPIAYFADLDPLSELISSLLSHRTKNADSARAFRALRERFVSWEIVRDAPLSEIQDAIAACTWPEQKAPRLQAVLQKLTESHGEPLSLDFLAHMPVIAARAFLEKLPGVGPKTSAATLAFSRIRARALPVDSHHHRVAARLGILAGNIDVGPAHAQLDALLPAEWDAQTVYDHHEALMLHGQRVCFFRAPACGKCVVRDVCDYYSAKYGGGDASGEGSGDGSAPGEVGAA